MKILPVLDLLDGTVVRGVAGKRDEYRPVESRLTSSAEPLAVACAFRDTLKQNELYVADLDAILHERPNFDVFRALSEHGFEVIVDAGLRETQRAGDVLESGAAAVIAGLETSPGPGHVRELCERFGPDRVIFSLDLKAGRPLGDVSPWNTSDPFEIGAQAVAAGVTRIIVLDLAQVGVATGVSTTKLCRLFRERFPDLQLITGGGVRNVDDLRSLRDLKIDGVLVASALHNGAIGRKEIASLG